MLNQHGYSELVIHPPPINFFTIFLAPAILKKTWMKKMGEMFAKFIFWFENFFYIQLFGIYEFVLCPFIYIRVLGNVIMLAEWF
jgi:hypothetical protein